MPPAAACCLLTIALLNRVAAAVAPLTMQPPALRLLRKSMKHASDHEAAWPSALAWSLDQLEEGCFLSAAQAPCDGSNVGDRGPLTR